jgi:hypothetical protein
LLRKLLQPKLAAQSRKARKNDDAEEIRNRRGHGSTENTHCSSNRGQAVDGPREAQREVKYYVERRTVASRDRSHRKFLKEAKKNKLTFF